jgi:hypothetical protein
VGALGRFRNKDSVFDESHTGTQNLEPVWSDRDDSGFQAHLAGAAVEKKRSFIAKCVADVLGCGGREMSETIGAGCGDGKIRGSKKGEGNRMAGDTEADRGEASGHLVGNDGLLWDDESKRAGPVFAGEAAGFVGPVGSEFASLLNGMNVNDERAGRGALLQCIDFADGDRVEGVGAEAVDSFCGENDEATGTKDFGSFLNFDGIRHDVNLLSQIRSSEAGAIVHAVRGE